MRDALRSRSHDPLGITSIPWIAGIFLVPLALVGTAAYVAPETVAREAIATRAELGIRWPGPPPLPPRRASAARSIEGACAALHSDLGYAVWDARRRNSRKLPVIPGVRELQEWLDAGLASGDTEAGPPPEAVRVLLTHRAQELQELIALLGTEDDAPLPRGPRMTTHLYQAHRALLALAWMRASDGRCLEAEQAIRASWRLAHLHSQRTSPEHVHLLERTVAAARKLPRLDLGATSGLGAQATHDWVVRSLEREAAGCIEDATTLPSGHAPSWMIHEQLASRWHATSYARHRLTEAREAALGARALRAPARFGRPLPPGAATGARSVARELDRLTVQVELTRKLAELRGLQASDGAWPERPEGIEESACHGLSWSYLGGTEMRLEPQGRAMSWLADRPGEPALWVASR